MSFPRYPAYKDSGVEWLGEVPEHWDVVRLKFVATVQTGIAKGKNNLGKAVIEVPYLRVANVQDGYLDLTEVAMIEIPQNDIDRYLLRVGDVLMNEGGDNDKLGRGHVWSGEVSPCIHQNHVFAVRPINLSSDWLNRVTGSCYAQFYFMSRSKQSTNLASISSANIMELPVVLPPDIEQVSIATFLDRETAKIDALVADYRTLIELLREKRQAVISHAVTKGLDPTAPMKDSGVEWLGEVPGHWLIQRNKTLFAEFDYRSTSREGELLSVSHITGVTPRSEKNVNMIMAETLEGYKECEPGDLVINTMWAWMGALGTAKGAGLVSPSYNVYRRRDPNVLAAEYYDYLCRTPAHLVLIRAQSTGVWESRLRLYADAFFEINTPVPPLDEQRAIVQFLDQTTAEIDSLITDAEQAITLLQERRTALISAAVTGKIDVRGQAGTRGRAGEFDDDYDNDNDNDSDNDGADVSGPETRLATAYR